MKVLDLAIALVVFVGSAGVTALLTHTLHPLRAGRFSIRIEAQRAHLGWCAQHRACSGDRWG